MAAPDLNIGPTGPVSSLPTSRALTRVTPVLPQSATPSDDPPLNRSGLNVRDVITTADHVVTRSRTPAIALDVGLEHARGSMVRNHPADALAMLDAVWSGARHTETGWYLRASSLALLGLPGEAARIAADAVARNPQSAANHFVLSLVKLSLGDLQAARASIADAVRHREPDALLLVQSALLEAQSGNAHDAEQLLRRATAQWPEHPALVYGRRMLREVLQHAARETSFAAGAIHDGSVRWPTPALARTPVSVGVLAHEGATLNAVGLDSAALDAAHSAPTDLLTESLHHLGVTLRTGTTHDVTMSARGMLTALSSGGALANTTSAARAHVMRSVVSAVLAALHEPGRNTSVGWAAESAGGHWQRTELSPMDIHRGDALFGDPSHEGLIEVVRVLVAALRNGRLPDAQETLRRARGSIDEMSMVLLHVLATDVKSTDLSGSAARLVGSTPPEGETSDVGVRASAGEPALLTPIRLGLALLPEADLLNHALRPFGVEDSAVSYAAMQSAGAFSNASAGPGAGGGGVGSLVTSAAVVALAVLAFAFRQPVIGIALVGAGGWLAVRSRPTDKASVAEGP